MYKCDDVVSTLLRRCIDVTAMLYERHEPAGNALALNLISSRKHDSIQIEYIRTVTLRSSLCYLRLIITKLGETKCFF